MRSETPLVFLRSVWPLPLSLATTHGISFDFSSSGYLDVSVPRVPRVDLWIQSTLHGSSPCGFPHSDIRGSMLIYSSPRLFAVSHVLRRLLMPRHSPYALVRLNFLSFRCSLVLSNRMSFTLQIFLVLFMKRPHVSVLPLHFIPPCGEIVVYPFFFGKTLN